MFVLNKLDSYVNKKIRMDVFNGRIEYLTCTFLSQVDSRNVLQMLIMALGIQARLSLPMQHFFSAAGMAPLRPTPTDAHSFFSFTILFSYMHIHFDRLFLRDASHIDVARRRRNCVHAYTAYL